MWICIQFRLIPQELIWEETASIKITVSNLVIKYAVRSQRLGGGYRAYHKTETKL